MAFLPITARNLFFAPTRAIRKRPRPKILARKFSGIPFQIPTGHELTDSEAQMLYDFTKDGGILALTGAGLSTESGITNS